MRSRAELRRALLELLERHPLEEISVKMVAERAQVGTATYYRHYPGKQALVEDVAAGQVEQLARHVTAIYDRSSSLEACVALCEHVDADRRTWAALLNGGAAATMRARLIEISMADASRRKDIRPELPQDLISALVAGTIVELLGWWLSQWNPPSARVMGFVLDRIGISPASSFTMSPEEIRAATGGIGS